jgi:predicted NAD/FAD-binding protein
MKTAIVGSGISGLATAWLLNQHHQVTLFEAADYIGGHTHTVDVELEGKRYGVDTGFLVFNQRAYPNLTAMLRVMNIETVATEMSFAVSMADPQLEWAGSTLTTLFAQKRNLARPGFWRMLQDTLRFNRDTDGVRLPEITLGAYLDKEGYSDEFRNWYLLPMASAIWSCPTHAMLEYPLTTFVRFCRNHGLLQITDRPQWQTIKGGARKYVDCILSLLDDVRLSTPVLSVERDADGVWLGLPGGGRERFDQVVLACHSDQALSILGDGASDAERRILGAIRYQPNRAVLHSDARLLPRDKRVWSSWNYMSGFVSLGENAGKRAVSVSYLISQLQPLPFTAPVIVSLNPLLEPDPATVLGDFQYSHPLFDQAAITAQGQIESIQGVQRTWFCGAWGGYGFHEDGLASALAVANRLGGRAPWQGVLDHGSGGA